MPIAQGLLKRFGICSPACPTAQRGRCPQKHLGEQEGGWDTKAGALPAQDGYRGCPMEQQVGLSNAMLRNSPNLPRCREGCDGPIFHGACNPGLLHPPSPPEQGTAIVPGIPCGSLALCQAEGGEERILPFTGTRATSSPSLLIPRVPSTPLGSTIPRMQVTLGSLDVL